AAVKTWNARLAVRRGRPPQTASAASPPHLPAPRSTRRAFSVTSWCGWDGPQPTASTFEPGEPGRPPPAAGRVPAPVGAPVLLDDVEGVGAARLGQPPEAAEHDERLQHVVVPERRPAQLQPLRVDRLAGARAVHVVGQKQLGGAL